MSKYSIGLDIGTNSVGWAVVDENNQLVKKNGKTLWGVRMFTEASDAKERRLFRTNRRRLARRKYRLNLLKEIFTEEINKVDKTFFQRLEDSFYKQEDKKYNNYHNLFNDTFTDKEYFEKYPTPYHLRRHLMESSEKEDIRFIYLSLHHMIKYRGNFLYPGETFNQGDDGEIYKCFLEFNNIQTNLTNEIEDYEDYFSSIQINSEFMSKFREIMLMQISKNDKKLRLKELFNVEKKTLANEFLIPLLVGSKCNLSSLSPVKEQKYEKCEITLDVEDLDAVIEESKGKVPEFTELLDYLLNIKTIVDHYYLVKLLDNSKSFSDAMIKKYEDHQNDLINLKKLIKTYLPKKYNECFRSDTVENNYPRYIGMNFVSSKKPTRYAHASRENFYKYITSLLKQIKDNEAKPLIDDILEKIENNSYLPRQNSNQNGSLPMQLNLQEMKIILKNQSKHYPFLLDEQDGISNIDKILSIFKFIVPYYVGPLNSNSKRSWIERSNEKIYPWNLEKVVDVDQTAINFIENMQRKCTYLKGERDYCLPKNSIIFSKYDCLSYLNKISINGSLIDVEVKKELFKNVFLTKSRPTKKDIYNYLLANKGSLVISTTHLKELPEVNCNMASYLKMKEIFGDEIDENIELIENIIRDITIFTDKKILEKRLYNLYGLDKNKVKQLKGLNYKDYSNLSGKLLTGLNIVNPNTGEIYGNLLKVMEETNLSLQEVLYNPDYRLIDVIEKYNSEVLEETQTESLDDFINENISVSPIMKRPLLQAHTIISEVKKILNAPIDKYYVECTRSNTQKKEVKNSRYQNLKNLYKSCENLASQLNVNFNELNKKLDEHQNNLRSDALYLYFTQMGKCMYSFKDIDLSALLSGNNLYDIDHIYPQSLVKDDSLSNRVLVLKSKNEEKTNHMLFEMKEGFLHKDAYRYYEMLRDSKLISKEKYKRLTKKELSSGELDQFVNRQIVATNQAVKGLIEVLKTYDGISPTDIIYSKAENVSILRQLYDLPKSRLANNFHHAHDAYLNVVVGRVVHKYFVGNHFNTIKDYYRLQNEGKTINVEELLKRNRYINNKLIWDNKETVALIRKNLYDRFDVMETVRTTTSNQLYSKVTILPAGKGESMKESGPRSEVDKYGGVTSYSFSKYVIIKVTNKKGQEEYILEPIPKIFENKMNIYLDKCGYTNYQVVNDNIKTKVIVEYGKLKYIVANKTNQRFEIINMRDRYFNLYYLSIIYKIEKYNRNLLSDYYMPITDDKIVIAQPGKGRGKKKGIELTRKELEDLYNQIINKYLSDIYSYSAINSTCLKLKDQSLEKFSISELIKICYELLKLLQTNNHSTADLTRLGLSKQSGSITVSKVLKPGMKFVSESVTGYYSKVIFEVPSNGI